MQIYKFRNCLLNTVERRVVKDGEFLDLTTKTFDVLQLLIERSGEIVTKDEILGKVWNGSFVEEGNLPVHISKLRRSLGETKSERFIETVQGSGYRFVSPVQSVSEDDWRMLLSGESQSNGNPVLSKNTFHTIAVLPLQNESTASEIEYLADGLTEGLINSLARVSNLRVLARDTVFRYKNRETDVKEIGETLGAAAVLTGRIAESGESLAVSVELINVADGTQIWGAQYDRPFSEIVKIQEEITLAVSEGLRRKLSHVEKENLSGQFTQDSESYRLYLKGKYFLNKRSPEDLYKAIKFFEKSISHDPANVLSYVEIVECHLQLYIFDYISRNELISRIYLFLPLISELDQTNDSAQAMYAGINLYLEWDFKEAEHHLATALVINPNNTTALFRYSTLLAFANRFPEASKILHQTTEVDPFSLLGYKRIGRLFYMMALHEKAYMYLEEALELEPTDYETLVMKGAALTELGDLDGARAAFQKSLDSNFNIETLSMIGYVEALQGRKNQARQIIEKIESEVKTGSGHRIKLAKIYSALGESEMTYKLLEDAFDQHELDFIALRIDPRFGSINHQSRFRDLVSKVGQGNIKRPAGGPASR